MYKVPECITNSFNYPNYLSYRSVIVKYYLSFFSPNCFKCFVLKFEMISVNTKKGKIFNHQGSTIQTAILSAVYSYITQSNIYASAYRVYIKKLHLVIIFQAYARASLEKSFGMCR